MNSMGRGIFLIILLSVTFNYSYANKRTVRAEQGTINLSGVDMGETTFRVLNGEFDFYWKSLIHPDSLIESDVQVEQTFADVPSYWSKFSDGQQFPERGFASYHLKILLPPAYRGELTFAIPVFDASYELFLDGQSVASNGKVGTSKFSEKPEYKPSIVHYKPVKDTIQMVVWVSNFHLHKGGFWKEMRVGPSARFDQLLKREYFYTLLSLGVILAFSLLFVLFFIGHRKDQSMLFFSLVLLGVAFRVCVTGNYLINDILTLNWLSIVRLEYISLGLILVSATYFFSSFLKSNFLRWAAHANAIVCFILTILILVLPVSVSFNAIVYFDVMIPLLFGAVILLSFRDAIDGSLSAILNIAGILFISVAFVSDILVASSHIGIFSDYVVHYAVLIFALMHGVIIIFRWVETYHEKAELNNVVNYINTNLEKLVAERTDELKTKNERIEKQNKRMSESLELQNRLFSIIGHDLRSPLATLFQLAEVLEEDIDPMERKKIIRSLRQLSRSTGEMIDNLIFWGRSQGQRIQYKPEFGYIYDVYKELEGVLYLIAEQKGIELEFKENKSKEVYFDKELMHLVLRNLINNAIKFTPNGGNIDVAVTLNNKDQCHVVSVQDTGIGMSEEMITQVLSGENSKSTLGTKGEKGTGLGLVLCKDLIALHNGTFNIESREGVGSRFFFTLPYKTKASVGAKMKKT